MTIPQQTPTYAEPYAQPYAQVPRPGRSLASAVAVFLGGYLLLASLSGIVGNVSMNIIAGLTGRPGPEYPLSLSVLAILQLLFAIIVVVFGLIIGNGSVTAKLVGSIIVAVGTILTFVFIGLRFNGLLPFPGGRDGIPFQAVFVNSWFAIVLFVGIAWLLSRRARLGWLSLLGSLILIPLPIAFLFANLESGMIQIVMFLVSGLVGAGIILAGRPLRD